MYSGITEGLHPVDQVEPMGEGIRYAVRLPKAWCEGLAIGASVSVDGVCQTVVAINNDRVFFEAMAATCAITTLGALENGNQVSIERSLCVGDEMGGHPLSGHIHGTAILEKTDRLEGQVTQHFQCPPEWCAYLLPKGYVGINGSSLTIADMQADGMLTVHLIPQTCKLTALGDLAIGDAVNIELDQQTVTIVKTVERVLANRE